MRARLAAAGTWRTCWSGSLLWSPSIATQWMRTKMLASLTLEPPDPLLARLKAGAANEGVTLKQLLPSYVEQGLGAAATRAELKRSAATLPRLEGSLAIEGQQLSNAGLFDLLDP